jgi:hypothetical protein
VKYRNLAVFPLAWAFVLTVLALSSGGRLLDVLVMENEAGKVLAALGCFAAALAFERGDYLYRAWVFSGGCYVFLLTKDFTGASWVGLPAGMVTPLQGVFSWLANASSSVGIWMLAHAWNTAGFDDDDRARARGRLWLAASVLGALAVTGWPLVHDVRDLIAGKSFAVVSVASDLGDMVGLALIAPLARTVLAMQGGVLRWPWAFLTAGTFAWVLYDIITAMHIPTDAGRIATEAFRALATAYLFSAGMAQRVTMVAEARAGRAA